MQCEHHHSKWLSALATLAACASSAYASSSIAPTFTNRVSAATSTAVPALPAASAWGLGLLVGAVAAAGLFFFWRYRK